MNEAPASLKAAPVAAKAKVFLVMDTTHLRFPIDEMFMKSGGAITGAGARGPTMLMLTGAKHSTKVHLTETPSYVKIEIPSDEWHWKDDKVQISNRAHLMICAELSATPAVNVVLSESISGETGVKVSSLFDHVVSGKENLASGAVMTQYGAWLTLNNAYGYRNVKIVSEDGDEHVPHFYDDAELNETIEASAPLLQSKYDLAWKLRESLILRELPNLTKPVSAVSFGLNGTGYAPSFSVAGREFAHSIETLEDALKAAMSTDLGSKKALDEFLAVSSGVRAGRYAGSVVTAISLLVNSWMPYRADGSILTLAGNQFLFKESELWVNNATNSVFRSDDCDGSAAKAVGIAHAVMTFALDAAPQKYPFITAAAKALAHYSPAVAVLAANAGHADDANETASNIAGHAVAVFIHNFELLRGLDDASTAAMKHPATGDVLDASSALRDHERASTLADTRLSAMYPASALARMPAEEAECIYAGYNAVKASEMFAPQAKFLVAEGTSPCASRLYTHDPTERAQRAAESDASNKILKSFSPSVFRAFRWLDSSKTEGHKFYTKFAELVLHPLNGLYTDERLRATGDATPHVVLTELPVDGILSVAGASPKSLATGTFAAVPLITVDTDEGRIFDEALHENEANTMKSPEHDFKLNDLQSTNLSISLGAIEKLRAKIAKTPTRSDLVEATWLVSFAALANNPNGVGVFVDEIASIDGVTGDVEIHDIRNLAKHEQSNKDLGTYVALNLLVPPL